MISDSVMANAVNVTAVWLCIAHEFVCFSYTIKTVGYLAVTSIENGTRQSSGRTKFITRFSLFWQLRRVTVELMPSLLAVETNRKDDEETTSVSNTAVL